MSVVTTKSLVDVKNFLENSTVTYHSVDNQADCRDRWCQTFSKDFLKVNHRQKGKLLWHSFSYNTFPSLDGEAAVQKFSQQPISNFYFFNEGLHAKF